MAKNRIKENFSLSTIIAIAIVLVLNVIGNLLYYKIDVTEEKRYSITDNTEDYLKQLDQEVFIKLWLGGELPAGFERLRESTLELLQAFRQNYPGITFQLMDPNEGSRDAVNRLREELAKDGMRPITLRIQDQGETVDKVIYPYVQLYRGKENIPINLLSSQGSGMQSEQSLNESIALLEYRLINGIKTITAEDRPSVILTSGRGELMSRETADFVRSMNAFYRVGRVNLDSVAYISNEADLLIVAKPRERFSDKDKFKIDQYLMRGGRVMWLLDRLDVTIDSLRSNKFFVPPELPLELDDILFTYGARILPNLVLDLECTKIPLQVGEQDGKPQFDLFNWFYHIAAAPTADHPLVRNLDRVNLLFPSGIDSIQTKSQIDKHILLQSSQYSRLQFNPVRLNFEILRYDPDKSKFNQGKQNLAVLYEGRFDSHYKDRVTEGLRQGLDQLGVPFKDKSESTKMIVVSDGDIARNLVDPQNGSIRPLGFNPYEQYVFDNKDFLLNCVDYLIGDGSIVEARTKSLKLRLMNMPRLEEEKSKWQVINLALPLGLLILFGLVFNYFRNRKFKST